MSVLGVGVRVWVGWVPTERLHAGPGGQDGRLKVGTIIDGPFRRGFRFELGGDTYQINTDVPYWQVYIPSVCAPLVSETVLTPISDDDPDAVTEPVEQELEA